MPGLTVTPLILTALPGKAAFARFDQLRRAHYPPERNLVPAHLTLFRHLPGTEYDEIARRLKTLARGQGPLVVRVSGISNLGQGVAFRIESDGLKALRAELADAWAFWLTPQDSHDFAPHITIQNKVSPREAKALYDTMKATFTPWTLSIEGLTLWRYLGGPWEKIRDFRFR